ncbi:MAG: DUF2269 domain-containing protein [Candidatus Azambacteria bacterium]|nr:DUF2269 domain-containing protein [Candidatus Azambacteria bacterium]
MSDVMHTLYDILHIVGVALFFCGVMTSMLWLFFAEKWRVGALRTVVKWARIINMVITLPGIVLITVSGLFQSPRTGGLFSQSWLVIGLSLFALSVLVWAIFFTPHLVRLLRIARNPSNPLPVDFFTSLHRLYFYGAIVLILPLGTMFLSIFKPILW